MKPSKWVVATYIASSTLFGTCLHFLSNANWKFWFENVVIVGKASLATIILPLVLIVDFTKVALASWAIYKAKKATLSNVSLLIVEFLKVSIATPAILSAIGLIALPTIAGSMLFIVSLSIGTAYNIALTATQAWLWLHANSEDEIHEHKQLTLKNGLTAIMTTLVAIGVGIVLFGGLAAVATSAIGITTGLILILGGLATSIIGYKIEMGLAKDEDEAPAAVAFNQAEVLRPLLAPDIPRLDISSEPLAQRLPGESSPAPIRRLAFRTSDSDTVNDDEIMSSSYVPASPRK